ncbi:MAG: acetyltransferase [Ignavibacteriae bacterium HGW-Ignavibacteriae-3]|nr:MAG: acetyltransferase [Ignavibacteriae bacterium HGW-Ignavibacteriae-3]
MDVKEYLLRIGIETPEKPSLEFLTELQNRHLLSIPFEDLDIPDRDKILLIPEKIYNKIIHSNRGGFCYELNGLFYRLLIQLGFNVDMLSARVYNHERGDLGPEFDHMTLLVHLEKDYLVDVGFGDSFRIPMKFPGGGVKDISGQYKIFSIDENEFDLMRKEKDEWKLQYKFNVIPRNFSDFEGMCEFQQTFPDSIFRSRMICTIATPSGRITLSNSGLTITENGKKLKAEVKNETEFYKLLSKYFRIELL